MKLFFGADTYRLEEKIRFLQEEFSKKFGGVNDIILIKEPNLNTILLNIQTIPFLTEKRLIIIENFLQEASTEDQKKLAETLDQIPDSSIVIFVEKGEKIDKRIALFKKIQTQGTIEEFASLDEAKLVTWIQEYTQKKNGKISFRNANFFSKHIGNDLWQLSNELEKLIDYKNNEEITEDDIMLLTKVNIKTTIFKFTDAIGQKNLHEGMKTLNILINSGEDIFYIFHMMIRQFRLLIEIKDLIEKKLNKFQIQNQLKQHPYVISNLMQQCRNFKLDTLKSIYQKLLQIEIATKNGKIRITTNNATEFQFALEKLMLESCHK